MKKTMIFQNNRNNNKYIEVRRYADGHFAWKQFTEYTIPTLGRNYNGCSIKRCHIGTWHRVAKRWLDEALSEYRMVAFEEVM